ncbi:hypothetical protein CXG81DRAFT_30122 [Caulochytrium protostelioides]|uniref:SPX domain-containing protein n=1 Tax=Caulochytrium protostelioides TaxID=1555241 RepID=A0A4P9X408_9FUNG|nr:hypothetical protein CXG81DRAFT_30122 [Caulochytrium protostelioides]|eukprot:RKO99772.1 hypothetical protein CXG81DRAFT_30122 [Caulochytrium protostelioides]
MKFSHSIQLNAAPDWQDHYLAYAQLKKLVYVIEKAKLGLAPLPPTFTVGNTVVFPASAEDADTPGSAAHAFTASAHVGGGTGGNGGGHRRQLTSGSTGGAPEPRALEASWTESNFESTNALMHPPISDEEACYFFTAALMGNLEVVAQFYENKSAELLDQLEALKQRIGEAEAQAKAALTSIPIAGSTRAPDAPDNVWNTASMRAARVLFSKQCTSLFIYLSELKDYIDLNKTGVVKILKKFDKVTGCQIRNAFFDTVVSKQTPFPHEYKHQLEAAITELVGLASHITDHDPDVTRNLLAHQLRDTVVWDRNTVWREMVQKERSAGNEVDVVSLGSLTVPLPSRAGWSRVFFTLLAITLFSVFAGRDWLGGREQSNCMALLIFVIILWTTEVFPLFVTGMLVPFLVVTLGVLREKQDDGAFRRLGSAEAAKAVTGYMFSPTIFLLLGSFSLASALSKHNIAKGITSIGKLVLLSAIFMTTIASMFISNVAAPVVVFGVVTPILRNLPSHSPYAKALVIGVALAANVGGMASPIASPQNIIAMSILNPTPSWSQWFLIAVPLFVVFDLLLWVLLLLVFKPQNVPMPPELLGTGKSYFREHPLDFQQCFIIFISLLTIALWCVSRLLTPWIGDMGMIAVLPLVAFFGTGILNKNDFNNFLWTVIMLAMAGIALGHAVESSGLLIAFSTHVGDLLHRMGHGLYWPMLLCAVITTVVTTFVSHSVGAVILLPVVAQVGLTLADPQPNALVMATALMCSAGMALPVSSFPNMNAIALEDPTGTPWVTVQDFVRVGCYASVIAVGALMSVGYLFIGVARLD